MDNNVNSRIICTGAKTISVVHYEIIRNSLRCGGVVD